MISFSCSTRHLLGGSLRGIYVMLALLLTLPITASQALAQTGDEGEIVMLEEVTVIGTRQIGRSAVDLSVPVDVIESKSLLRQGNARMDSVLSRVIPSLNVNQQPISDEASFVRPLNMRGLPSDSTLVLINGKRRHRSSVISFLSVGGASQGSHGVDVSTIPAIALKRVEVLRDGASAQYGSDAIAGVVNFVLDDSRKGLTLDGRFGEFYKGDGDTFTMMGNWGLPLADAGFVNLSMEYREADPTNRAVQTSDAQDYIDAGNTNVRTPGVMVWGAPRFHYDAKFFGNAGYDLGSGHEVYAFGNYAERKVEGGFYYRDPNTRGGIFDGPTRWRKNDPRITGMTNDPGDKLDFYDVFTREEYPDENTDKAKEAFEDYEEANVGYDDDDLLYDTIRVANLGDSDNKCKEIRTNAAADYSKADPGEDCAIFNSRFPGGFTPQFGATLTDLSAVVGTRGELYDGWHYDVSAVFGEHTTEFFMENTINPQLFRRYGNQIPTSYKPGSYRETDRTFNVDLSRPFETDVFASPLNVALGAQYRTEEFEVGAGGENSWYRDIDRAECDGVAVEDCENLGSQGFGIGSNGFTGFHPDSTSKADRGSYGVYLDLETDVRDDLLASVAVRYENIEQFGDTLNGKVSARYQLMNNLAVRGSANTGFRVPTVGQSSIRKVTTSFAGGMLVDELTVPADNPAAIQKGAVPLEPETSINLTAGAVTNLGGFNVTMDYFNITLKDRIALTSPSALTQQDKDILEMQEVGDAQSLSSVKFYANGFTSKTQGIDLVAERSVEQFGGVTHITFAGNWTSTKITDIRQYDVTECREGANKEEICISNTKAAISDTRKKSLEENIPKFRFTLTANHLMGPWRLMGGVRYYGGFFEAHTDPNDGDSDRIYGLDRFLFDTEVSYTFDNVIAGTKNKLTFLVGAQNLFNTYPSDNPVATSTGAAYPLTSPFGFNGGFYYLRGIWEFDI